METLRALPPAETAALAGSRLTDELPDDALIPVGWVRGAVAHLRPGVWRIELDSGPTIIAVDDAGRLVGASADGPGVRDAWRALLSANAEAA